MEDHWTFEDERAEYNRWMRGLAETMAANLEADEEYRLHFLQHPRSLSPSHCWVTAAFHQLEGQFLRFRYQNGYLKRLHVSQIVSTNEEAPE